jgi:hypothetical protein
VDKILGIEVDDQENIKRVKERVDLWLKEVPKKLQKKLKRQASKKGLTGDQALKYIQKVERRLNRRKIG